MLGPDELERYARHIVLREVGGPGQARLQQARVLVDRRGRARRTGTPLPRGGGRRHAGRDRRRHRRAVEPAAAGDPRHAGHRRRQSRQRRRGDPPAQPARRGGDASAPARCRQRARSDRPLRHRGGRLGQFRHALPRVRRLLPGAQAAGHRRGRHLRRHADHHPGARAGGRRHAQSDLSLPVSRAAAARHRAGLRRGRHSRCADRRDRIADGARSAARDRRLRRGTGRPPADDRCALDAVRDARLCLGSRQPALGRAADDQGSVGARVDGANPRRRSRTPSPPVPSGRCRP